MIKWIINKWREWNLKRVFRGMELSPRGRCLRQYMEDIVAGKDNYISAYEEALQPYLDDGYSRVEAAEIYLKVYELFDKYGCQ